MQTIRNRISRPYFILIVSIPIMILILFNFIVSFETKKKAEEDLQTVVNEITYQIYNGNNQNLLTIIRTQHHANTADLLVFDKSGHMSRMFNKDRAVVSEEVANLAYKNLQNLSDGQIGKFNYKSDTYYIVTVGYDGIPKSNRIVYITKGLMINEFVNTINIVLIIVCIFTALVAVYISSKVTKGIAKPIENLTHSVENIETESLNHIDNNSDCIELNKLTTEINALVDRIYNYNQEQKLFLHNASHELRTPLMGIQGYADGIEMGVFKDAVGTAHLISEQSKKLTKLVDSLLTLARTESFNDNNKLNRLNISENLQDLLNIYTGYAGSNHIQIKSIIQPNIFAYSNSELITASIGNIVSNAIRYAKTTVTISLSSTDSEINITIKDDGNGIENPELIFDRFFKGDNGNFGLGLSIAKTSIKMMNGKIKVFNNNGAVFEIILNKA